MILKDSFEAIIESIYLEETLGKEIGKTDIRVNPRNNRLEIDYTIGKTIILTDQHVDPRAVQALLKNDNTVISRVSTYEGVKFCPYITYINFNLMWSGEIIECPPEIKDDSRKILEWMGDYDSFECDPFSPVELYFPKILGVGNSAIYDNLGNLTSLGWLLHQVGINTDKKTKFRDLDLIKTKKIIK